MGQALPIVNGVPEGALAIRVRRSLRTVRRIARVVADELTGPAHPYITPVETPLGARKRELMDLLVRGIVPSAGWRLDGVDPAATAYDFIHSDGRKLRVALRSMADKKTYAQTKFFGVAYQASGALASADLAFLDSVVVRLREGEIALAGAADFPGRLLDRRAAEVTLYLQDHRVELRPSLACNHHCAFCNSVDRSIENAVAGADDLRRRANAPARPAGDDREPRVQGPAH